MPLRRHRRARLLAALLLTSAVLLTTAWLAAGCSQTEPPLARSGDRLTNDAALYADLDGDGVAEQILIEGNSGRLVITDGATVYRSREKWRVAEGFLGDTDRNGLLEVVTLLDGPDGRHLGLFAYMGAEYRERLVTSALTPRPLSLQLVTDGEPAPAGEATAGAHTVAGDSAASAGAGDLIVLTEESTSAEGGVQTTTYRWNGFGFTALEPATQP